MRSIFRKMRRVGIVTEPLDPTSVEQEVLAFSEHIATRVRARFSRSLLIYPLHAGACMCSGIAISALDSPYYDLERCGLRFTTAARQADCLLVTGPITSMVADSLHAVYDAMPEPRFVVAVGDCAQNGGVFAGCYAVQGGVTSAIPIHAQIPGCPPSPQTILFGLLQMLDRQPE